MSRIMKSRHMCRLDFVAMGCHAEILVVGGPQVSGGASGLATRGRARTLELHHLWTRFEPDSDVSRVNAQAGNGATRVDSRTINAALRAVEGWRVTNGSYDPTVHNALVAYGYDRTFRDMGARDAQATGAPVSQSSRSACSEIQVDVAAQTIALPVDVGLDFGGIGKGLAGDMVADELIALGAVGVMVNIGGDVRVVGEAPDREWVIAIDDPSPGCRVPNVRLRSGAVAVSSTAWRRWSCGDGEAHHIIDPRTMRPTQLDIVGAVVVAGSGWWAEVLTKALMVEGPAAVQRHLEPAMSDGFNGVAHGLVIDSSGSVTRSSGFAEFSQSSAMEVIA